MNTDSILIKNFIQANSKAAARTLEDIEPEKLAEFFNDSPNEWLLVVIPHINPHWLSEVFEKMKPDRLASLFEIMEINQLVVSIRLMNEVLAESMLNKLSDEKSKSARRLLQYLDHSVGAHMDPSVFTLEERMTVKDAIAAIKRHNEQVHPQIFVVDSGRKLLGVISLSDLISGEPEGEIRSLMHTMFTSLSPETPIQSVLNHQEWQNFYSLPVVDHASWFLGTISLETIRAILAQSTNEGEEMGQGVVRALGELYRIGLTGLLRSATELKPQSKE